LVTVATELVGSLKELVVVRTRLVEERLVPRVRGRVGGGTTGGLPVPTVAWGYAGRVLARRRDVSRADRGKAPRERDDVLMGWGGGSVEEER
jgi:hypothetical protein